LKSSSSAASQQRFSPAVTVATLALLEMTLEVFAYPGARSRKVTGMFSIFIFSSHFVITLLTTD
jgi:hypothetical protein